VSEGGDIQRSLASSARGLVRDVAEKLDIEGVKEALAQLEGSGDGGRLDADVTSAVPLTEDERHALESRLRARHGDDLPVAYHVDPTILGGLKVRVGDRFVDGSVATRLEQLREKLLGVGTS